MKRYLRVSAWLCLLLAGCTTTRDVVFQTSTIDALLAGVYDGDLSCRRLLKQGDFGIGTFDNLDGEMILVDGDLYQVKADGKVYRPDLAVETPFAAVCRFEPGLSFPIEAGADFDAIKELVDRHAPNQNLFCAVRISGRFRTMKTRSVPAQSKPYPPPPLSRVTKNQPEFPMTNVDGTIVGFRCPAYVKGINVPGYHLHFISKDRSAGGHILSFEADRADCSVDVLSRYLLVLPTEAKEFAATDLSKDRSSELKAVEE